MIQFYLKPSTGKDDLIMMRIYNRHFKDGVFSYSTKVRINPSHWDKKNKVPKWNSPELKVTSHLEDKARRFMLDNEVPGFTREMLRDHLTGEKQISSTSFWNTQMSKQFKPMIELWQEYYEASITNVKKSTKRAFGTPLSSFRTFLTENKILKLLPGEFDFKLYQKYAGWLRAKHAESTEGRYLKMFKRFITYLEDEEIKLAVGFKKKMIKYEEPAGLQNIFEQEQLDELSEHNFVGVTINRKTKRGTVELEDVKWLLLLQCYTGFRISDLPRIGENRTGDFIKIKTKKTGQIITQPITPQARKILDRYNNTPPKINDADYNQGIKEIYKIMWPDKTVQILDRQNEEPMNVPVHTVIRSHDAVRTFVTMALQIGMSVPNVAAMVGKTPAVIWKHYNKSTEKMAQKDMLEKFNKIAVKRRKKKRN